MPIGPGRWVKLREPACIPTTDKPRNAWDVFPHLWSKHYSWSAWMRSKAEEFVKLVYQPGHPISECALCSREGRGNFYGGPQRSGRRSGRTSPSEQRSATL